MTPGQPQLLRTVAFFDGQNLFHAARNCFSYHWPNYNAECLARAVCKAQGWTLAQTRFYTGIHESAEDPFWHTFWTNKLNAMRRGGVWVYSRPLRYHGKSIKLADGSIHKWRVPEEKGIDVRIALDVIRLAIDGAYDVALLFSQDQDLSEVAAEIRTIAKSQNRWIKIASAFPSVPGCKNSKGVYRTDWIKIDKTLYDGCIDPRDYRPKPKPGGTP